MKVRLQKRILWHWYMEGVPFGPSGWGFTREGALRSALRSAELHHKMKRHLAQEMARTKQGEVVEI